MKNSIWKDENEIETFQIILSNTNYVQTFTWQKIKERAYRFASIEYHEM